MEDKSVLLLVRNNKSTIITIEVHLKSYAIYGCFCIRVLIIAAISYADISDSCLILPDLYNFKCNDLLSIVHQKCGLRHF